MEVVARKRIEIASFIVERSTVVLCLLILQILETVEDLLCDCSCRTLYSCTHVRGHPDYVRANRFFQEELMWRRTRRKKQDIMGQIRYLLDGLSGSEGQRCPTPIVTNQNFTCEMASQIRQRQPAFPRRAHVATHKSEKLDIMGQIGCPGPAL